MLEAAVNSMIHPNCGMLIKRCSHTLRVSTACLEYQDISSSQAYGCYGDYSDSWSIICLMVAMVVIGTTHLQTLLPAVVVTEVGVEESTIPVT